MPLHNSQYCWAFTICIILGIRMGAFLYYWSWKILIEFKESIRTSKKNWFFFRNEIHMDTLYWRVTERFKTHRVFFEVVRYKFSVATMVFKCHDGVVYFTQIILSTHWKSLVNLATLNCLGEMIKKSCISIFLPQINILYKDD